MKIRVITVLYMCFASECQLPLRVSDEECEAAASPVKVSVWPYYAYVVCDNERCSFALRRKAESLSLTAWPRGSSAAGGAASTNE